MTKAHELMKRANKEGFDGSIPDELFATEPWTRLTEEEVKKGIGRLQFKHPLAEAPLWKVIPALKPIRRLLTCCLGEPVDRSSETFAPVTGPAAPGSDPSKVKPRRSTWKKPGQRSAGQLDDFRKMQKRLREKLKRGDNKEAAFRKVIGDYYD